LRSCGIYGGHSGTGVGSLRVLRFPCQSIHRLLHTRRYPRLVQEVKWWPTYQVDSVSTHHTKLQGGVSLGRFSSAAKEFRDSALSELHNHCYHCSQNQLVKRTSSLNIVLSCTRIFLRSNLWTFDSSGIWQPDWRETGRAVT
jgi:hypothetical protein